MWLVSQFLFLPCTKGIRNTSTHNGLLRVAYIRAHTPPDSPSRLCSVRLALSPLRTRADIEHVKGTTGHSNTTTNSNNNTDGDHKHLKPKSRWRNKIDSICKNKKRHDSQYVRGCNRKRVRPTSQIVWYFGCFFVVVYRFIFTATKRVFIQALRFHRRVFFRARVDCFLVSLRSSRISLLLARLFGCHSSSYSRPFWSVFIFWPLIVVVAVIYNCHCLESWPEVITANDRDAAIDWRPKVRAWLPFWCSCCTKIAPIRVIARLI